MAIPSVLKDEVYFQLEIERFNTEEGVRSEQPIDAYAYNFRNLMTNADENQNIVHSVAGLFLASLQSMDKETVYENLTEQDSFTITFVSKSGVVLEHLRQRLLHKKQNESSEQSDGKKLTNEDMMKRVINLEASDSASSEDDDEDSSIQDFQLVYSSEFSDSSDESESSEHGAREVVEEAKHSSSPSSSTTSEKHPYSPLLANYKNFIGSCIRRKLDLLQALKYAEQTGDTDLVIEEHLAVEHLLGAACSFRIRHLFERSKRIVHITFLAVRTYLRRQGLGSFLVRLVLDPKVVGSYDAVIVHADLEAQEFFRKHGFTDDVLINDSWSELAGEFLNCKLMTYIPGFKRDDSNSGPNQFKKANWMANLDRCIEEWRSQTMRTHTQQFVLYRQLREQMIQLFESIRQKDKQLHQLRTELRQVYSELLTKRIADSQMEKYSFIEKRIAELDTVLACDVEMLSTEKANCSASETNYVSKFGDVEVEARKEGDS